MTPLPSIRLIALVVAHDSGFDRRLSGSHRRTFQDGHNSCACVGVILRMLPGVTAGGRLAVGQLEHFDESVPNDFTLERFLNPNRIAMMRLTVVQLFHRFFEQLYIIHAAILANFYAKAIMRQNQIRTPPPVFIGLPYQWLKS